MLSSLLPLTLILLSLSLLSTTPSAAVGQVGYQYVQSAVGGQAAIFLNLWGTLGGCGGNTSDELYVNLMTGSVRGRAVAYPYILNGQLQGVVPDNCVNLTGRTLNNNGLGLLFLTADSGYSHYQLYNAADSPDSSDNYNLITAYAPNIPNVVEATQLLSLEPPVLISLTGRSSGPSVGLLFNGGFEQVLSARSVNADRTLAAGWTGNYTLLQYGTASTIGPALPGQSSTSQRRYVSLLPGHLDECDDSDFLHANCTANSLSQSSLPLTLGLHYSLSWYASCGTVGDSIPPCSYTVTTTGPSSTTLYTESGRSWVQQSQAVEFTSLGTATTLLTFTPLTGNPLLDTILFTYASTDSHANSTLPSFPAEWTYGFINGSLFEQPNPVPFSDLVTHNTDAANVTGYSTVRADGQAEVGAFVHTYTNYSFVASSNNGSQVSTITAQGGRDYTLSVRVTVFAPVNNNDTRSHRRLLFASASSSLISLSIAFDSVVSPSASSYYGGYKPGLPPVCTSDIPSDCNQPTVPHTTQTRRRLLQVTPYTDSSTEYFTCSEPGYPCNNTLLTLTVSTPNYLVGYAAFLQIVTYNMDAALTDVQLSSVVSSLPLPILPTDEQTDPSGAVGDPQFTGLLGQRFQVHGVSGSVYNIITDSALQVNARFDFLSSGSGPHADIIVTQPWTHPGTYMGAMSFQMRRSGSNSNASQIDVVLVEAGESTKGFAAVAINGRQVTHPFTWQPTSEAEEGDSESLTVRFVHSHVLEVHTSQFHFRLVNSDRFINHEAAPAVPLHALHCHGLLGQTRLNRQYPTAVRYIEGRVEDYAVGSAVGEEELLGSSFVFNLFRSQDSMDSS